MVVEYSRCSEGFDPGFRYEGLEDPSRFSSEKVNYSDLFKRCCRVLDDFDKVPTLPMLFSAANPPENTWVSSRQYYSSTFPVCFLQLFDVIIVPGKLQGVVLYVSISS